MLVERDVIRQGFPTCSAEDTGILPTSRLVYFDRNAAFTYLNKPIRRAGSSFCLSRAPVS